MKYKFLITVLFVVASSALRAQEVEETPQQLYNRLRKMPRDTARLSTLLKLAEAYTYMPPQAERMDTIAFILKEAKQLNVKFNVQKFTNHIDILDAQNKYDRDQKLNVESLFLPITERCRKTGDMANECRAWQALGLNAGSEKRSKSYQIDCFQKALALAVKLNDNQNAIDIIRNIAQLNFEQGNNYLAEKEILQIIDPQRKASVNNLMYAYDLLSRVYFSDANYHKAMIYGLKAIEAMRQARDSSYAYEFYSRISAIHKTLNNLPESLEWSWKAYRQVVKTKERPWVIVYAKTNVVKRMLDLNKVKEGLSFLKVKPEEYAKFDLNSKWQYSWQIGNCYQMLKKYQLARESFFEMIRLVTVDSNYFSLNVKGISYQSLGAFYLETKQNHLAKQNLLKALEFFRKDESVVFLKDVYQALFRADSATHNYQQAISFLLKRDKLKDSIFNIEKSKKVQELQVVFDTEQKNKNINELQAKDKLQQLSLKSAGDMRNLLIAGFLMLIIIMMLLYRQTQVSKKNSNLIQGKNQVLERFLKEKEWLLKEVHHRVKNNLHTVICLLESQARFLKDDALKAIETSQNRIFAMSLIHQKLYRSEDVKTIDMAEYIPELIRNLEKSFDLSEQIGFELDIASVSLNAGYAIPLGLIINEAVTNAVKYAFPEGRPGRISILFYWFEEEMVLTIADNGVGLPSHFKHRSVQSLGMDLMNGLCNDIDGEISVDSNIGTRIMVSFNPSGDFDDKVPASSRENDHWS
ncbi:hypothetical protein D0C36_20850 [Mucilaginibacter conchicola]|uniref:histidine kinase n=1 Tax=Mucilaginibacter conchicola TaxID=2303333 RepID=A0A372NMS2_9SPHI|nr:sensor histidine kinase [Mucilaginibacter conchicola]RFZ90249.1 hypothetical protein D0C36_20850 [Mucilaginibacter conchicola]